MNLGLRYDLYTRDTELNHQATTFIKGPGQRSIDNITTGAGQIKDEWACDLTLFLAGHDDPGRVGGRVLHSNAAFFCV